MQHIMSTCISCQHAYRVNTYNRYHATYIYIYAYVCNIHHVNTYEYISRQHIYNIYRVNLYNIHHANVHIYIYIYVYLYNKSCQLVQHAPGTKGQGETTRAGAPAQQDVALPPCPGNSGFLHLCHDSFTCAP